MGTTQINRVEYLDIVNERDEVVGRASREEIWRRLLPHRNVHVMVFNDRGEVALQLRSKNLPYCPGHWCTSAAGHVSSGLSYEEAVRKELLEELGIEPPLKLVSKEFYTVPQRQNLKRYFALFEGRWNGPFVPNPEEVERVEFFTLAEIARMTRRGEKFLPDFLHIFKKYYGNR